MSKKLFLGSLAMAVAFPVIVVPVQAQEVRTEISQDFTDVSKSYSFYKEIMTMRDRGIIGGYPDNMFKPAQAISRVHVASLLVRSIDLPAVRVGKEFKDVPKTSQHYEVVQKVYRAGIFDGNKNGTFGINDNLTRAQMAKVLVNAFGLDIYKDNIFTDVSAEHWANDYISSLYMSGITLGSNGKYMPNDPVSRAHYAAFLYRALNLDEATRPEKPETKPDVKPTPKPEPQKPVVEPDLKPHVKPNLDNPFPKYDTVKTPAGWVESKTGEYDKRIKEIVFEYSPKRGSGISFGKGGYQLYEFDGLKSSELLSTIENMLKNHMSGMTINEWIADVNEAIKTGDVVIAKDYSYGLYIKYGTFKGKPFPAIIMIH